MKTHQAVAPPSSLLRAKDASLCRVHLKQGSKSFALANLFMPAGMSDDATALYAFCRVADDLIDDSTKPREAYADLCTRLDALCQASKTGDDAIDRLPRGEDRALSRTMRRHDLPRAPIDALLEGFLWDAQERSYATLDDTLAYAARVAGSVGVCMAWLMGQRQQTVLARAADLGVAMQLTNIARDVGEDARRGRVYLPDDALLAQGLSASLLRAAAAQPGDVTLPALPRVLEPLLVEADALYARGRSGIAALPKRCRLAIDVAACLYQAIGAAVLRDRAGKLRRRAVVPLWRKMIVVARCLLMPGRRLGTFAQRTAPALGATQFLLGPHR